MRPATRSRFPGSRTLPFLVATIALALVATFVLAATGSAFAVTPGQPLTTGFPRTGIWWPETWKQPMADISRYDYVLLGAWQYEFASQIKARHADAIVLGSGNACEPSAVEVAAIPTDWFLTQVGSTLSAAVDGTTRTFTVAASTNGTLVLFKAGDTVVVGQELAKVTAVSGRVLTVTRGKAGTGFGGHEPAAHAVGTRVAALVPFWGDGGVADPTAYCPRVNVGNGPRDLGRVERT